MDHRPSGTVGAVPPVAKFPPGRVGHALSLSAVTTDFGSLGQHPLTKTRQCNLPLATMLGASTVLGACRSVRALPTGFRYPANHQGPPILLSGKYRQRSGALELGVRELIAVTAEATVATGVTAALAPNALCCSTEHVGKNLVAF